MFIKTDCRNEIPRLTVVGFSVDICAVIANKLNSRLHDRTRRCVLFSRKAACHVQYLFPYCWELRHKNHLTSDYCYTPSAGFRRSASTSAQMFFFICVSVIACVRYFSNDFFQSLSLVLICFYTVRHCILMEVLF